MKHPLLLLLLLPVPNLYNPTPQQISCLPHLPKTTSITTTAPSQPSPPDDGCQLCEGLTPFGEDASFRVTRKRATYQGTHDQDTTVELFSSRGGRCCPTKKLTFAPGTDLWWSDTIQKKIYLKGLDDRWSALASFGIWAVSVQTGESTQVAAHLMTELSCQETRFAGIVLDPGAPRKFSAGSFRLMIYDFIEGAAPKSYNLGKDKTLLAIVFGDEEAETAMSKRFQWSEDCQTFSYTLNKKKAQVWRAPK